MQGGWYTLTGWSTCRPRLEPPGMFKGRRALAAQDPQPLAPPGVSTLPRGPAAAPPPPCLSCLLCAAAALQPCTCPGLAACGLPRRGLKGHPRTGPEPGCLAQVSGTAVRVGGSELASWSSSSKSCLKGPVDSGASPQVSRRSRCASCGSVAAVPPWPPAPQPPTALLPVPPSGTPSRWLTPSLCLEPVSAVWSLFLPETGARA